MNTLELTKELVAFRSPSHESNAEVSDYLIALLKKLGFDVERSTYADAAGVEKTNILARIGPAASDAQGSGLAYFCHSDVVPADDWVGPGEAYRPVEQDGKLYGRGSCDMKGSAACMLTAFAALDPAKLSAPFYFGCTADEERSYQGAMELVQSSSLYREMVQHQPKVLIGEPTSLQVVHAHKGICTLVATSHGKAAHSSSRDGLNANLALIPFLQIVKEIYEELESQPTWQNEEFDPPTMTMNIGVRDSNKALNVTSAKSQCLMFYRPLPQVNDLPIIDRLRKAAEECHLVLDEPKRVDAVYTDPNSPFVTEACRISGQPHAKTVSYGTDAGAMPELKDKIVCGPGNISQAHTVDEWIALDQLESGTERYGKFLEAWCLG